MTEWFTADTHFGHKRIIELAARPFGSVEEMDEVMIWRWNERVKKPGDLVYHLGDFAFAAHDLYLRRLNGNKQLVVGNHDHRSRVNKAHGWGTVNNMLSVRAGGLSIELCHYALRVWNKSQHGSLHLYGHSHGHLPGDSQCLDVGVDCWDFRPVSLEEIRARLATQPPRVHPDHHKGTA
jgi:calcineurin-like phosphoesterase family protein